MAELLYLSNFAFPERIFRQSMMSIQCLAKFGLRMRLCISAYA